MGSAFSGSYLRFRGLAMGYTRPQPLSKLPKVERHRLLHEYYEHYRHLAEQDSSLLNRKVPREAFSALLDEVGELILRKTAALASQPGSVQQFLSENSVPECL